MSGSMMPQPLDLRCSKEGQSLPVEPPDGGPCPSCVFCRMERGQPFDPPSPPPPPPPPPAKIKTKKRQKVQSVEPSEEGTTTRYSCHVGACEYRTDRLSNLRDHVKRHAKRLRHDALTCDTCLRLQASKRKYTIRNKSGLRTVSETACKWSPRSQALPILPKLTPIIQRPALQAQPPIRPESRLLLLLMKPVEAQNDKQDKRLHPQDEEGLRTTRRPEADPAQEEDLMDLSHEVIADTGARHTDPLPPTSVASRVARVVDTRVVLGIEAASRDSMHEADKEVREADFLPTSCELLAQDSVAAFELDLLHLSPFLDVHHFQAPGLEKEHEPDYDPFRFTDSDSESTGSEARPVIIRKTEKPKLRSFKPRPRVLRQDMEEAEELISKPRPRDQRHCCKVLNCERMFDSRSERDRHLDQHLHEQRQRTRPTPQLILARDTSLTHRLPAFEAISEQGNEGCQQTQEASDWGVTESGIHFMSVRL